MTEQHKGIQSQIVDTRITDHWGVEWSEMEIVRDFLQNFYDANPIEKIQVTIENDTVIVSAPAEFDYNELLYMGSDKGEDKIGQYGEGFKAATLNALRNHQCSVEMQVKEKQLTFFLENKKIGRSEKKVVSRVGHQRKRGSNPRTTPENSYEESYAD